MIGVKLSNWINLVYSRKIIELSPVNKYTKQMGLIKLSKEANIIVLNSALIA